MTLELLAAALLGAFVIWLVLGPLVGWGGSGRSEQSVLDEIVPVEETRRGRALMAVKELDFDLATGKLSEGDHAALRERYVAEALNVLRAEEAERGRDEAEEMVAQSAVALEGASGTVICARCGPRPEADARFCSSCGGVLTARS